MTESARIANIIWKQMNALDKNLVWCMGTRKPIAVERGLQFQVNGLSFKGIVQIRLEYNDTYTVTFMQKKRKLNKEHTELLGRRQFDTEIVVAGEYKEVYFDTLMPLLEDVVENRDKQK